MARTSVVGARAVGATAAAGTSRLGWAGGGGPTPGFVLRRLAGVAQRGDLFATAMLSVRQHGQAFAAKAADVIGLYLDPPANALVISVDEKPSM